MHLSAGRTYSKQRLQAGPSSLRLARAAGLASLFILALLAGLSGMAIGAGTLLAPPDDLLFTSDRGGNPDLYRADLRTRHQVALTRHPADDLSPAWSPDGSVIVFVSRRDGNAEIYLMSASGGAVTRLTQNPYNDSNPVWSPDGSMIAYESQREGRQRLVVVDVRTGEEHVLNLAAGLYAMRPAWAPDSAAVVYYGDDGRDPEIFMASLGEEPARRLTTNTISDWDPVWSPDGRWLVYYANHDANLDLYAVGVPTGYVVRLTYHLSREWLPAWSPDGRWLAYASERRGRPELYVMDSRCFEAPDTCGDRSVRVRSGSVANETPAWSPDSRRLAFVAEADGNLALHVADLSCVIEQTRCRYGDVTPVTRAGERVREPAWRP